MARRFQPVMVEEPTVEDTISILRGLKEKYEQHHKVRISDSALVAEMKRNFTSVKHAKPPASRKGSVEWFVVAQGFKGRSVDRER